MFIVTVLVKCTNDFNNMYLVATFKVASEIVDSNFHSKTAVYQKYYIKYVP